MKKYNFVARLKATPFKERAFRKLVDKISFRLKDKTLFPEKVERAKDFFRRLKENSDLMILGDL